MTSKCQVFSSTVPEKPKSWTELAPLSDFFNIYCDAKYHKKIEEGPFEDIKHFSKKSQK